MRSTTRARRTLSVRGHFSRHPASLSLVVLVIAACHQAAPPSPAPSAGIAPIDRDAPADLLDHHGIPVAAEDWSLLPFSDQGSWIGWSLPSTDRPEIRGSFGGPFLFGAGRWLAPRLLGATLRDENGPLRWQEAQSFESEAQPGRLVQRGRFDRLRVALELWIDDARTTMVQLTLHNEGRDARTIDVFWTGSVFADQAALTASTDGLHLAGTSGARLAVGADRPMTPPTIDGNGYRWQPVEPLVVAGGESARLAVAVGWALDGEPDPEPERLRTVLADTHVEASAQENAARWQGYLDAVRLEEEDAPRQVLAWKALQTLIVNWRAPAGRMRHSGLFPSSNVWYFNGYWAWDSWKHAVALVRFDPALAKEQVRAMFAHQNEAGMVADVVYLDPAEDNWRDTKPPLAGWAIEAVYRATEDLDFVRDLYPHLVRYHAFWYADRDHDGDGLCEYGSTDGTLVAARWESGMDNAVRFDHSAMRQNGPGAWSLDQESVDLNSYLYREKLALATLAEALDRRDDATRWRDQADTLGARIRDTMFDAATGWFHDIDIDSGTVVPVQGPEGWIPLWAGVASDEQAAHVRKTMLDTTKFRTHVPFPTVARDDPGFSDGYWRGLVWLDQVYFALEGLRRYGYDADADALEAQLYSNLEGATVPGVPLYENYHPLTGAGQNVKHFSWTAAHLLLLTQGDTP